MKITKIDLHRVRSGELGEKGAGFGDSRYSEGGWQANALISNPMSIYPEFARSPTLWMGPGQDPYAIEIFTDDGAWRFAVNHGDGAFACAVIHQPFSRFLVGQDPFNIETIWDQMYHSTMPCGLSGVKRDGHERRRPSAVGSNS